MVDAPYAVLVLATPSSFVRVSKGWAPFRPYPPTSTAHRLRLHEPKPHKRKTTTRVQVPTRLIEPAIDTPLRALNAAAFERANKKRTTPSSIFMRSSSFDVLDGVVL